MILYLHGRHGSPGDDRPPANLVAAQPWGRPLERPALTPEWLERPFSTQIDQIDGWLASADAAIGHSHGGWLLLWAALQRVERGAQTPPMLLLSCHLWRAGRGRTGALPPRGRRIERALLNPRPEQTGLGRSLRFVHGADDDQCPVELLEPLAERGIPVVVVPGGHRLDTSRATAAVRVALGTLVGTIPRR